MMIFSDDLISSFQSSWMKPIRKKELSTLFPGSLWIAHVLLNQNTSFSSFLQTTCKNLSQQLLDKISGTVSFYKYLMFQFFLTGFIRRNYSFYKNIPLRSRSAPVETRIRNAHNISALISLSIQPRDLFSLYSVSFYTYSRKLLRPPRWYPL